MTLTLLYTHRYSLALVMILLLVTAATDDSGPPTAVLGDSGTIRCHVQRNRPVTRFYIQRPSGLMKDGHDIFIHGCDSNKPLVEDVRPEYKNRTTVNCTELSLHMSNISVSDEGLYKCVVFFTPMDKEMPEIYLKVTAKYSVPTLEHECGEGRPGDGPAGKSCQLSCSAGAGYPQSAVNWTELNHSRISVIHNNSAEDPSSKTWTITQTIVYSCEHPINVSCIIRDAVSPSITICETESFPFKVIVAIVVLLVFVLLLILVLVVMKCCFCNQQINQEDPDPESVSLNSREPETSRLNGTET